MAGLDPATAWDRSPAELKEYIDAYHERMERQAYMYFNLAATTAAMMWSKRKPEPWECFPGWIQREVRQMSDDEIYQNVLAWCGGG